MIRYRSDAERDHVRKRAAELQADPRLRLDPSMLPVYIREIFATGTRKELDTLTRRLWKRFNNGLNDVELFELKQRILERRVMLDRSVQSFAHLNVRHDR